MFLNGIKEQNGLSELPSQSPLRGDVQGELAARIRELIRSRDLATVSRIREAVPSGCLEDAHPGST